MTAVLNPPCPGMGKHAQFLGAETVPQGRCACSVRFHVPLQDWQPTRRARDRSVTPGRCQAGAVPGSAAGLLGPCCCALALLSHGLCYWLAQLFLGKGQALLLLDWMPHLEAPGLLGSLGGTVLGLCLVYLSLHRGGAALALAVPG